MQQLLLDIKPNLPATLDNFVIGSNYEAFAAVKQITPGQAIYLWGDPGCGRSHLLTSKSSTDNCYYLNHDSKLVQFESLANDDIDIELIAVDDVGNLSPQQQALLFTIFNRWRSNVNTEQAFALLCSGNYAPLNMPLREDLRTRLGWDLVFRLNLLSDSERAQALQDKANNLGLKLSNEVLNWVLTHYDRDMRNLTALLNALDVYSLEQHRAITIPLLKDLINSKNIVDSNKEKN